MTQLATGVGEVQIPTFYKEDQTSLTSRFDVNRELSRYVFSIGDHLEPKDKESFKYVGGHLGGLWIGHSEVQGAPTMKRTNYMMLRGAIVPLETTPWPKKADHREEEKAKENYLTGKNVPAGVRGYMIYAGDTLNYLRGDLFSSMGVVEITGMMGRHAENKEYLQLQNFFFPEWALWVTDTKVKPPTLLSEWETLIKKAESNAPNELYEMTAAEMLESCRLFRDYASRHIEMNRQRIMSQRNTNTGGFFIDWNNKSKLYSKQLGEPLEEAKNIAGTAKLDDSVLKSFEEDRKLQRETLEVQREQNVLLLQLLSNRIGEGVEFPIKATVNEPSQDAPTLIEEELPKEEEGLHSISTGEEPRQCSERTKTGAPCSITPEEGETMCVVHKRKKERKESNEEKTENSE